MSRYPRAHPDPIQFVENKTKFITFNYDRSLEYFFNECYTTGHTFVNPSKNDLQISLNEKFSHVYGKVSKLSWERSGKEFFVGFRGYETDYHTLELLSKNIFLINERENLKRYKSLRQTISSADRIFFLGFSYQDENLQVLDIPNIFNENQKIFGTAFQMTNNEIAKIRGKLRGNMKSQNIQIRNMDCLELLREFL
jgi:hypothetical protein